jgi:nitrogen fixation protein NifB
MMKRQSDHPCFGGDHSKAGRIHLPVAPGCNIKCGFCERKFDCANESRPGVTSRVLTPEQAVERVRLVKLHMERQGGAQLKVVGIAGPGDPLANPRTFETFRLVREAFPEMTLCLSTNGLLLPEKIETILAYDVHSLTVTINALTPETGARIYEWIRVEGHRLDGETAAAWLLERQLEGVRLAAAAGMPCFSERSSSRLASFSASASSPAKASRMAKTAEQRASSSCSPSSRASSRVWARRSVIWPPVPRASS